LLKSLIWEGTASIGEDNRIGTKQPRCYYRRHAQGDLFLAPRFDLSRKIHACCGSFPTKTIAPLQPADVGLGMKVVQPSPHCLEGLADMKFTIEIDSTPLEMRQFLGFPDVQPMQEAVLAELQRTMMAQVEKLSPEGLMRGWFLDAPKNADWIRDMIGGVLAKAGTSGV